MLDDINVNGEKREPIKLYKEIKLDELTPGAYILLLKKIGYEYEDYIKNQGYSLTIDDICDMLDISENYVQRYILKYIDRIEITKEARQALKLIESDIIATDIINKKIIINRDSFLNYLSGNLVKERDCIVFEFKFSSFEDLKIGIKELKIKINDIETAIYKSLPEFIRYDFIVCKEKFQSIDNMKIRLGLRHNVQIYRLIKKYSYQKYILNKYTVRYVMDDSDINKILEKSSKDIIYKTSITIKIENTYNENEAYEENTISISVEKYALSKILNMDINQVGKNEKTEAALLEYLRRLI